MSMKKPLHPGASVRLHCLEPLGLTVTGAAKVLGVTRQAVNNIVNGKSGISPQMAIRLSKAFGTAPESWLGMQLDYDLARARLSVGDVQVARIRRAQSASGTVTGLHLDAPARRRCADEPGKF
jgi:addiction module HigA family antidote